ncbi:glycosyltransferase family 2 protein [Rhodovibrionaceae bacterium A322]
MTDNKAVAAGSSDTLEPYAVITQVLNEEGNIGPLIDELMEVLANELPAEIIVVNDASTDGTVAEIEERQRRFPQVRLLHHVSSCGKSLCMVTAARYARSPWLAFMDGDWENDPQYFPEMLAMAREKESQGVGLVNGVRLGRKASASKRLASRFANKLRGALLQDDCPDTGCGLKIMRRDLFLALPAFNALHRFMPALVKQQGYGIALVPVADRERKAGVSKYTNFRRAMQGIVDLMGIIWLRSRTTRPAPDTVTETHV